MDALPHRLTILIALSFVAVAVVSTWPLPLHLSTHLTGLPTGDTGVYVWNAWLFRHQLMDLGQSPFWTTAVLPLDGPTNLALHNYTVFADLLALPLQSTAGVVASFNVVYIVNIALCGFGMFLLARRMTGAMPEAWIAGVMFALAPYLVARGSSHFSLAAAAPLPFFVYFFDRAWFAGRLTDAAAAGITIAWAFYCDPYYAVYTVMLGALIAISRVTTFHRVVAYPRARAVSRVLNTLIAGLLFVVAAVYGAGGGPLALGPVNLSMRTLYTPMLIATVLVMARVLLNVRVTLHPERVPVRVPRLAMGLAVAAAIALAPELHALASLAATDQLVGAPVLWRSSAPGVDLLSFFVPNPNHPLAPEALTAWLAAEPGRFDENVVSLSYVALGVVAAAWWWTGARPLGSWLAVTLGFSALALGPFLRVAGVSTYIPTPWTLLRYVPVIGEARMPQRFGIVAFLGLTVLFAAALTALGRRFPARRPLLIVTVGAALAFELLPVPRRLADTAIPAVYQTIARDPRPVRVLDVPFGVRDGLSSLGDFNASSLVYQTVHGKEIIGGYLSRVDDRTKRFYQAVPTLSVLMALSAERTPAGGVLQTARDDAGAFVTRANVGYVVIDTARASRALHRFAVDAMALERVDESGSFVLYATPLAAR